MQTAGLQSFRDPLSVDNKPFYTFYRTLKCWTTGVLGPPLVTLLASLPSVFFGPLYKWGVISTGGGLLGLITGVISSIVKKHSLCIGRWINQDEIDHRIMQGIKAHASIVVDLRLRVLRYINVQFFVFF